MRKAFLFRLLAIVTALVCCAALCPAEATAAEMTQGPYTYAIANGEVTITDCKATATGALTVPKTIDGYPVTAIGDSAFFACSKLTSVTVPEGVTYIGRFAFGNCSALKTVSIPSSVVYVGKSAFSSCPALTYNSYENIKYLGSSQNPYLVLVSAGQTTASSCTIHPDTKILYDSAFNKCTNLTQITIPAGVTVIGWETFSGCSGLKSVTVPTGVTSIGYRAFYQCAALSSVTLPDTVTSLGKEAFAGCADAAFRQYGSVKYLGNGSNPYYAAVGLNDRTVSSVSLHPDTKLITDSAFSWYGSLKEVRIPNGVTIIGEEAFSGSGLETVTLPNSVTAIGVGAFESCEALTSVTLPNGISYIEKLVFHDCHSLSAVVIPDSVKTIGKEAFFACENLSSVTFGKGVTTIEESAFQSTKLDQVNIHAGITSIAPDAFACDSLTGFLVDGENPNYCNDDRGVLFNKDKTTLIRAPGAISGSYYVPKSVTALEQSAFSGCKNLTYVVLPESITQIPSGGFYLCQNLTSVMIPDSVKSIGEYAFQFCKKLTDVNYAGTEDQWKTVLANTGSYNTYLLEATIHFNYVLQTSSLVVFTDQTDLRIAAGDNITLLAGAVDGYGQYTDPSGITFQVTDNALVDVMDHGFDGDCFYVRLRGVNPGTTTVTFSDSATGYTAAIPVTVFENNYPSYSLGNVPETSALGLKANFGNFNGLFIDNYRYTINDDMSAQVTFHAYNINHTYGTVEVYRENGELCQIVLLNSVLGLPTSVKSVVSDGTAFLVRTVIDGVSSDYRDFGRLTRVDVTIPKNGYIRISSDPWESDVVMLVNYTYYLASALSAAGDLAGFDPTDSGLAENITKRFLTDTATDGIKTIAKNLTKDLSKEMSFTAVNVGNYAEIMSKMMQEQKLLPLITNSMKDSGLDVAEGVFLKMLGGYGVALEAAFAGAKVNNLVRIAGDIALTCGGGTITIQNQGGGIRAATQIKLESEVDFAPDVALQAYSVELDEDFLEFVRQADRETYDILTRSICHTYNISLLKGEEKVQHSDYVTVYIPIPKDLQALALGEKVKVYRIEEDGSLTDMDAVVEDGCMRFVTDHFSLYTLVGENQIPGDVDGSGKVDQEDAVYLLLYTMFGENFYPLDKTVADADGSGKVDQEDAVYLLLHTMFGEAFYPLK